MQGITKTFHGVKAIDDVNLDVRRGDFHSICGENGAGKSTLMKVLSGVYPHGSYDGKIVYQGKEAMFKDIKESELAGIFIIRQELTMIPELSVTENIFIGNEIVKSGLIDWDGQRKRVEELLASVGLHINPDTAIKHLGVGQQLVEIAKALPKDVKLLILDEPTRGIDVGAKYEIYSLIHKFADQGKAVILVSSELPELLGMSDRIYTLFEGRITGMLDRSEFSQENLMRSMTSTTQTKEVNDHEGN